jgi:hypothetical protein
MMTRSLLILLVTVPLAQALIPMIDGGTEIPVFYKSWMDDRIAKQAATAVQKAISAGHKKIEVNFPSVPNVEEAKFGTPLNQKFGQSIVAKDLNVKGGYKPGSEVSRQLIAFSNIYWAKKIAPAVGGGFLGGRPVSVVTAEPVTISQIQSKGSISDIGSLSLSRGGSYKKGAALIAVNPGGEETWDRIQSTFGAASPFVVLNNAYSTTVSCA